MRVSTMSVIIIVLVVGAIVTILFVPKHVDENGNIRLGKKEVDESKTEATTLTKIN